MLLWLVLDCAWLLHCCLTGQLYSIQLDHCWILYFNKIAHIYLFPRRYLLYSYFCNTWFLIIFNGKIPGFFGRYVCSLGASWRYFAQVVLLLFNMKFFFNFFPNQFFQKIGDFFCVLALENQEAFSERRSLVSGVLQGLV